jgi:integrase
MPRIRLTKSAIDGLQTGAKEVVFWDLGLPGFGVKVTPKARKVFIVMYRVGGAGSRLRKYTIGPYGRITLPMAKGHAQKIFAARLDGRDPAAEKREARRKLTVDGVDDLVEKYIRERLPQLKSGKAVEARLRREVLSHWAGKSVHDIKKRDVIELVGEVGQRSSHAGHRVLKDLKTFFKWCVGCAILDHSPADGVPSFWRFKSRNRVLTDDELAAVLKAARSMEPVFGGIVELLALTAQRREEVTQLTWAEIDQKTKTWLLSASRAKNGRDHLVHLSEQAWNVLGRMHRHSNHVFVTPGGRRYFQAFSRYKRELDALSGITGWVLHDLRRTAVSGMARLGVPPHIADKVLNHQSGTIAGVAAVYQRHDFMAERKQAMELWGIHVAKLIETTGAQNTTSLVIAA